MESAARRLFILAALVLFTMAALAPSKVAQAQLVPTGQFSGQYFEGFNIGTVNSAPCVPGGVFAGQGTLCTPAGVGCNIWGGVTAGLCVTMAYEGTELFVNVNGGPAEFVFNSPISRFGGQISAIQGPGVLPFTFEFYNSNDLLLDTATTSPPEDCSWNWFGWDILYPDVVRIVAYSAFGDGTGVVLDALEIDTCLNMDGDGDTYTDCEDCDDTDPAINPGALEVCDDGIDNDCDGLPDCMDDECDAEPVCIETICDDGLDDDMNGLIDCFDPDCFGDAACIEALNCNDGIDNDLNGLTDCEDSACPTCDYSFPGAGLVDIDEGCAPYSVQIGVTEHGDICDLNVSLEASASWAEEIGFWLEHDTTGTIVVLQEGIANFQNSGMDLVWDDEASLPNGVLYGSVLPFEPLDAFDGEDMFGFWTLHMQDIGAFCMDNTDLIGWSLEIIIGDQDNDGVEDCNDNCVTVANPTQDDYDGDGMGNECDDCTDVDGDGYGDDLFDYSACSSPGAGDCNDTDPAVNPGATEVCDLQDNDCDGTADAEQDLAGCTLQYYDNDGDNWGIENDSQCLCFSQPPYQADFFEDCDDTLVSINPGEPEFPCDYVDTNCDGLFHDQEVDDDGDGQDECQGDCDDTNGNISGNQAEVCDGIDNNCDGFIDEGFDTDGDGYLTCDGDCDDTDPAINPGATEVCNNIDDDCDLLIDEGFDTDSDGYTTCDTPDPDCDDGDDAVFPGATEVCNNIDDNCDGTVDEGFDTDGDGYTTCDTPVADCDDGDIAVNPAATEVCNNIDDNCDGTVDEGFDTDGDGYTTCDTPDPDCDDGDDTVFPGATETCNGVDDDCDGSTDEGLTFVDYYPDVDGDGFGDDSAAATNACDPPTGMVADDTDCDDAVAAINPDADEVCDSVDNDCDGTVDEDDAVDAATWYLDGDNDGYGDPAISTTACDQPTGYVGNDGDCDDTAAAVSPGNTEICNNGVDDDCDAATDEDVDDDGDGFSECEGDCDDDDALLNPDADEVCDNVDNDCDPTTDEAIDGDGDLQSICNGDCDDTNPAIFDGATELCDGIDNDCDGAPDADEIDVDMDGSWLCDTPPDCDDDDDTTYPGAPEQCDNIDNDCDGVIDEDVGLDQDGDGFNPCQGDCDDNDAAVFPGAKVELCDGKDTDCDGTTPADEVDIDLDGYLACEECDDTDGTLNNNDNDMDGASTCDGDCNDNDALLNISDADADGDTTCAGDCNDADALLNLDDNDLDGFSTCTGDCNDADGLISPNAIEVCDTVDNNCDGVIDDVDADMDGFLDTACGGDDCDDTDDAVNPLAAEVCDDTVDNDCDGDVDGDDIDCGDDDDSGDDDSGDDDSGDDDTQDDDDDDTSSDDDTGEDDDTGDDDTGDVQGGCACEGNQSRLAVGPAAMLFGLLALALVRRRS